MRDLSPEARAIIDAAQPADRLEPQLPKCLKRKVFAYVGATLATTGATASTATSVAQVKTVVTSSMSGGATVA